MSTSAGVAVASVVLWIAFQHSPQGEFFDPQTGAVDWPYSLMLFGTWFLAVAVPVALAAWTALVLRSHLQRRLKRPK